MQVNCKTVDNFERTKCAACEYGKVHCQPDKLKTTNNNHMKDQEFIKDHILPGQMVSEYHYISRVPGRLYHTKGKPDPYDMFSRGYVLLTMQMVG